MEPPSHVKLAIEKAKWDEDQKRKQEELLSAEKVIIKKIDIPFFELVFLLVKIGIASIPALIIIAFIMSFFWGIGISAFTRLLIH